MPGWFITVRLRGTFVSKQKSVRHLAERDAMIGRWGESLSRDLLYNPNLSIDPHAELFSLAFPPRHGPRYAPLSFKIGAPTVQGAPTVALALCAIFRDEALYLEEWLQFHHIHGVEHFYLYDNGSADDPLGVLDPWVGRGALPADARTSQQLPAYADCLRRHGDDAVDRVRGSGRVFFAPDIPT